MELAGRLKAKVAPVGMPAELEGKVETLMATAPRAVPAAAPPKALEAPEAIQVRATIVTACLRLEPEHKEEKGVPD